MSKSDLEEVFALQLDALVAIVVNVIALIKEYLLDKRNK